MAKKLSLEKSRQSLIAALEKSFARWKLLFDFGGSDPFWSDGANMLLVRNHIEYYKSELQKMCGEGLLPKIWHKPTPPEMPYDYMARKEELLAKAASFTGQEKEEENLRSAVKRGDLVRVRQLLFLLATPEELEEFRKKQEELFARNLAEVRNFEPEPKTAGKRMEWLDDIKKIRTVTQLSLV